MRRVTEPALSTESITPELALVDPALGQLARSRLHEPGGFRPAAPMGGGLTLLRTAGLPAPQPAVLDRAGDARPHHSIEQSTAPSGRFHRLHALVAAGLIDSFGLALGWTVFNLYAVTSQGLAAVGVYNAAMLVGVALSAPATAFLSSRLDGRRLLQATAVAEAALRIGTFGLLLQGAPIALVAAAVGITNVLAWTGYAGMRAEVAAVDRRAAAMTWYVVSIASIEAAGAAVGALLPVGAGGTVTGALLVGVIVWYGVCLFPTLVVARRARVAKSGRARGRPRISGRVVPLGGGFAVMILAAGPTLLSVGLAAEFHGRSWVAASAVAFTAGSLAAPLLAAWTERSRLPASVLWPLLGAGMIGGWVAAPWHPGGLLLAQCLAGLCMTTFEGTMDSKVVSESADGRVTAGLAWTAAARALGSSVAVALVPIVIVVSTIETVSAISAALLVTVSLAAMAAPVFGARFLGRSMSRPTAAAAAR